jgi:hypothetical protein
MPSFAIEVYRPGVTESEVRDLVRSVKRILGVMALEGTTIRYVGCTVSLADEVCFVRLESDGQEAIADVVLRLGLRDARITEMVDLVES